MAKVELTPLKVTSSGRMKRAMPMAIWAKGENSAMTGLRSFGQMLVEEAFVLLIHIGLDGRVIDLVERPAGARPGAVRNDRHGLGQQARHQGQFRLLGE